MGKEEIDEIINSFTNPLLFKKDDNEKFLRDENFNLIPSFKVK